MAGITQLAVHEEIQDPSGDKAWLWVVSASALAAKSLGSLLSLCGSNSTTLPHLHSSLWADCWLAAGDPVFLSYTGACTGLSSLLAQNPTLLWLRDASCRRTSQAVMRNSGVVSRYDQASSKPAFCIRPTGAHSA